MISKQNFIIAETLPDGNGLDFCGQHRHTPFISMSASDSAGAAIAGGAMAFLEKPCLCRRDWTPRGGGVRQSWRWD